MNLRVHRGCDTEPLSNEEQAAAGVRYRRVYSLRIALEVDPEGWRRLQRFLATERVLGAIPGVCEGATVAALVDGSGLHFRSPDPLLATKVEEKMKDDCQSLVDFLSLAERFGGKEVHVIAFTPTPIEDLLDKIAGRKGTGPVSFPGAPDPHLG
jgi:hypothetical protein